MHGKPLGPPLLSAHRIISVSPCHFVPGIPLVRLPMICKVPFDLYKIYNSVRLLGGFITVSMKQFAAVSN
jgi:hypothetical protein